MTFKLKKSTMAIFSITTALFAMPTIATTSMPEHKAVELSILHINDHHSYLEPHETRIQLNGKQTKVDIGGFSAVNAKLKNIKIRLYYMRVMLLQARFILPYLAVQLMRQ